MTDQQIPSFDNIVFDQTAHRYTCDGQELTGVNRFLQQFQKPFDRDTIAARVAERESRPVEDVIREWEAKGQASIALGSMVHEYIESVLTGKSVNQDDPFLGLNEKSSLPEIQAFDRVWGQMTKGGIRVVQTEWTIGCPKFGVAGTVDCLVWSEKTKQFHLVDWKTGKMDTYNRFEQLLPPFELKDASKLNIYSLQLSMYRLILDEAGFHTGESYIVHLSNGSGAQIHKAVDFRGQFKAFLGGKDEIPF